MFGILAQKKRCPKCGEWKPETEFSKSKNRRDGLRAYCRVCYARLTKEWRAKNSAKAKEYNRQYRREHSERFNELRRIQNASHPEKNRARSLKWQKENPEKVKERNRKWAQKHPDKRREAQRKRYKSNPKKTRDLQRKWRAANPGKAYKSYQKWAKNHQDTRRLNEQKRRARKNGNGGTITEKEWRDLQEKYGHKCLCCRRGDVKLTLDHIVPLEKGGPNVIGNAQPLCGSCNSKKGTKIIDYR